VDYWDERGREVTARLRERWRMSVERTLVAYGSMVAAIDALVRPDRFPLSSRYDPRWLLGLDMGPHPLWQLEEILPALGLRPGMRVLDLGSGRGATSVFLARECGVTVTACDLWVGTEEVEGGSSRGRGQGFRHGGECRCAAPAIPG
jgi:2-polyprenyl-3-methyl-5-hydroxy-6-metoxy-1,4-benzoquinol methylase